MNKTISISLAGFSFIIEEQAYEKLNAYLQALRNSLEKDEADEVMYDIEIRIAEIFRENLVKDFLFLILKLYRHKQKSLLLYFYQVSIKTRTFLITFIFL